MDLAEKLLLLLSRDPQAGDAPAPEAGDPLALLRRVFPQLAERVAGRDVLEFGCGAGRQSAALAALGARRVVGIDTSPRALAKARAWLAEAGAGDRVELRERLAEGESFDLVVSQNSMEHFADPAAVLADMARVLRPSGTLLITFGPPWLAPYGSHMFFFTRLPWVNLLFSERTVMRVRARFRDDGATRYEECEEGLNRMTVGRFERLVARSGLALGSLSYECSLGAHALARLPLVRELFTNQVSCVLTRQPATGVEPFARTLPVRRAQSPVRGSPRSETGTRQVTR